MHTLFTLFHEFDIHVVGPRGVVMAYRGFYETEEKAEEELINGTSEEALAGCIISVEPTGYTVELPVGSTI
jgi:hypothetical protein